MRIRTLILLACSIALASPAGAVIIASGDGTGNTGAPVPDPGFDHVGRRGQLSSVYLGSGWAAIATHAGAGDVVFGGVTYRMVPGSRVQLDTQGTGADVSLIQLETDPGLPGLSIADAPPSGPVVMVGRGRNRGAATTWDPGPGPSLDGFLYGPGAAMRWGTNQVEAVNQLISPLGRTTVVFSTVFDEGLPTPHEAQGALGDSGGAVFDGNGELTGLLISTSGETGQPPETALYTNASFAAQLSWYKPQIEAVLADVACSNGVDDDGDGLVDHPDDPGCASPDDAFERSPDIECDDGIDNDGDGAWDYPADPGCGQAQGIEQTACSDGIDNDGDGRIDFDGGAWIHGEAIAPPDAECWGARDRREHADPSCGLGFELAPVLLLLARLARGRCYSTGEV